MRRWFYLTKTVMAKFVFYLGKIAGGIKNQKFRYKPFSFPGGQVDKADETPAIKLYKQNKKVGGRPFIASVNQAAAVRN